MGEAPVGEAPVGGQALAPVQEQARVEAPGPALEAAVGVVEVVVAVEVVELFWAAVGEEA